MSAPRGEKPYRVYRGGRVKGKVPTIPRPTRERGGDGDARRDYRGPGTKQPKTGLRGWSWKRWTALSVLVLLLVFILWTVAGYLSFRSGVKDANKRLPESARLALVPDKGMILSHPTDILLLGTDHSLNASRASDQHSDSVQILRTDPKHLRPAEVYTLCGDASKAKRVLGWAAKTKLPQLVKIMVKADLARVGG